ncbi:MAG TPA: hypothetical protein VIW45_17805 [Vicinamibacterales bacterium]|jgi:hypothetical protein
MDAKTKKTVIAIVVSAVVLVGLLAAAVVGGTAFFIYRHVNAQFTPAENAEQRFAAQRARFAGEQPFIEMTLGDDPIVHREPNKPRQELHSLHALVYDARAGKLTHVDIPGWLLRMMSGGGRIRIANLEMFDDDRDRVTLEDLERHGPGLLLDLHRGRASQVLVWTE